MKRLSVKVASPFNRLRKASSERSVDSLDDDDDSSARSPVSPSPSSGRKRDETPNDRKDVAPGTPTIGGNTLPFSSVSEVKRSVQQEKDVYVLFSNFSSSSS